MKNFFFSERQNKRKYNGVKGNFHLDDSETFDFVT